MNEQKSPKAKNGSGDFRSVRGDTSSFYLKFAELCLRIILNMPEPLQIKSILHDQLLADVSWRLLTRIRNDVTLNIDKILLRIADAYLDLKAISSEWLVEFYKSLGCQIG